MLTAALLTACAAPGGEPVPSSPPDETGPSATPTATATAIPSCQPSEQDAYVYHPDRLQVLSPCLRLTGTVVRVLTEADGDLHIRVQVDAAYAGMLTAANANQPGCSGAEGCLVVEPICVHSVTQADAVVACAADPDPLQSLPQVGQHVWLRGRYVLDLQHGGWSELHPLYAWGVES